MDWTPRKLIAAATLFGATVLPVVSVGPTGRAADTATLRDASTDQEPAPAELSGVATAAEIRVATATNFSTAMRAIAQRFESESGTNVILSFASTGSHFAQIRNGAPYDAFFAADVERPRLLEQEGLAIAGSRFTYAIGQIVLWSPHAGLVDTAGAILAGNSFRHLALANPRLAPYGRAAEEVLRSMGLWGDLQDRIVRGENIGQTFQFVRTGNAELGFIALSQLRRPAELPEGSVWYVPDSLYSPIEQQAVALTDSELVKQLLAYVRSPAAVAIIRDYGYDVP